MKTKKLDWKSYEQLAEKIYHKLEPGAVVKHDDSIFGHASGTQRQIDVSIRKKVGGHEILVVVQARDRKRAPDVNSVGEFATVIRDVRASKGVMVCRKPPGKNAARLAKEYGIDMCSAFDVNDRKWVDDLAVPVFVTLVEGEVCPELSFASNSDWTISLPPKPEPGFVSLDGGKTRVTLQAYMRQVVAGHGKISPGRHRFVGKDGELSILLNDKDWVPVPLFRVELTATLRKLFRHCKAEEYLALKNYSTGELTIAEMRVELPAFNNATAWRDAAKVPISEQVTENVPVLELTFSVMLKTNRLGLQVLPQTVLDEERERLCNGEKNPE